ncbi:MAG: hypothetical protein R3B84_11845 [Zavarzinella sp.]
MGVRRDRLNLRLRLKQESRIRNGHFKREERARRHNRLLQLMKAGTFPYTPVIQSWLSAELGKPITQITEADAKEFVNKG